MYKEDGGWKEASKIATVKCRMAVLKQKTLSENTEARKLSKDSMSGIDQDGQYNWKSSKPRALYLPR